MKLQKYARTAYIITLLVLVALGAYAQDEENVFTRFNAIFDGYLRNATAVRLEEPDQFTQVYNCLHLEYSDWLTNNTRLTVAGRAVYDGMYDLEEGWHPDDEADYHAYLDLREALLEVTAGDVDVYLGKQQVVWGKTDGFRVTDVVNPLDYRNTTATEFLDSRIPLWMLNLEYYPSMDHSVQVLLIPDTQFAKIPEVPVPNGVTVNKPDVSLENTKYGLKYSGFLKGWDVTLNYLYSWNDIPAFTRSIMPDGAMSLTPEHHRLHIVGGTFATVVWDGVLRGELAAQLDAAFSTTDPADRDGIVKRPQLAYAVAYERDWFDVHWLLQAFQQRITNYDTYISEEETMSFLTLNGSKTFLRETLEASSSVVYDIDGEQWTFHPELAYAYNDAVKLTCGVEFMVNGEEQEKNADTEQIHAGITYNF
jgi:hypothetical protein